MNCGSSSRPVARSTLPTRVSAAVTHGADLDDCKRTPAVAQALLTKQHRAAVLDEHGRGGDRHHWCEDDETGAGAGDIERPS